MANITVDPQVSPFSYTGGTQQVTVTYDVAPAYVSAVTVSDNWIGVSISSSAGSDTTIVVYNVTVSENNGQYRTGSVTFKCGGSGSATTSVNIIRQGTGFVVNRPLWKDTYYEISGYTEFNYSIAYNGNRVYSGKSYKAPDDTYIRFNVTKIAQDWIHQSISDIRTLDDDVVQNEDGAGILSLCDEFGTEILNWKYLYQYDGEWSGESHYNMSEPINGHSDPRMKLFYTQYNDVSYYVYPENLLFEYTGGTQEFTVFTSSDVSWYIPVVPEWTTFSTTAGTGTTTVTVTVGENETGMELGRQVLIEFILGPSEIVSRGLWVRQYPQEEVSEFTLEFMDAGYIEFEVIPMSSRKIGYSVNGGTYVEVTTQDTYAVPGNDGDTIKFKAITEYGGKVRVLDSSTAHYRAYGILSSIYTTNYRQTGTFWDYYDGSYMFEGTKIVDASNVVFPTYGGMDKYMFADCTELVTGPKVLPATGVSTSSPAYEGMYYKMFYGCTSLTNAPVISALTLSTGSCAYMFAGCTSLTSAATINVTGLTKAPSCCTYMYSGCTSLTAATIPQATDLTPGGYVNNVSCYEGMYKGCTSLVSTQSLPSSGAPDYAYSEMFAGCTSLVNPPSMSTAYTFGDHSCYGMFSGCTSLASAAQMQTTPVSSVYGLYISEHSFDSMYKGCTSLVTACDLVGKLPNSYAYSEMFAGCTSLVNAPTIYAVQGGYYKDGVYICYGMFSGCTSLVNAPVISLTATTTGCCESMFDGCTSLVNGPVLSATTLYPDCYRNMFSGCTSLMYIKCMATSSLTSQTISNANATYGWVKGVETYDGVFEGSENYDWEGLTDGDNGIPINWSRKDIPLTLIFNSYQSHWLTFTHNRTLVSDVGDLTIQYRTGTTNSNKSITFGSWTNLTSSSGGTTIYPNASIVQLRGDNARYGSLPLSYNTFSGSTFYKAYGNLMSLIDSTGYTSATTISEQYAFNRLFSGTELDNAKHLVMPATTVPMHCYTSMFQGNTHLTSAPTLPAPTLANSCYNEMFRDCTHLSYIRCLATDVSAYNCTYNWVNGVAASGTFAKATAMTGWGSGNDGIPANWTVVDS